MAKTRTWTRDPFLISTIPDLLDFDFINTAFASSDMYWAKPLDRADLKLMLSHSYCLGLYKVTSVVPPAATVSEPSTPRTPSPTLEELQKEALEQVGLARFITDHVSTTYLTDVYVLPEYRKDGLGRWLIGCCNEVINEMPALRRAFLMTDPKVGKHFYEKELGFHDVGEESEKVVAMTRRAFAL